MWGEKEKKAWGERAVELEDKEDEGEEKEKEEKEEDDEKEEKDNIFWPPFIRAMLFQLS